MVLARWWLLFGALASGCFTATDSGFAGESFMEEDHPPYNCMESSGGGDSTGACETTGTGALDCVGSSDCPGEQVCTASFDGDIGVFSCQLLCVPNLADSQWCVDSDACCDAASSCVRGLCLAPGETGDVTGSTSEAADSSGSSGGSSSGGSETSSDSSSSGSSTGSTG